jgi:hypothetical protein
LRDNNSDFCRPGFVVSALARLNSSDESLCKQIEFDNAKIPEELGEYWPQLLSENAWKNAWGECVEIVDLI